MGLTRDQIIAAIDARKAEVTPIEVPEWGGTVYARRLSVGDVEASGAYEAGSNSTVLMIITCLADEDGNRLFTEKDIASLTAAELPVIMRVFAEVAKINGLETDDLEEAIAVFGAAQPDASSSS